MTTKQWLVLVDDYPGTIQKRIEVRQKHLSVVGENPAVKAGGIYPFSDDVCEIVLIAGAYFSKEPTTEDPMPFEVGCKGVLTVGECDDHGGGDEGGVCRCIKKRYLLRIWGMEC
jgi:hypothetical protein